MVGDGRFIPSSLIDKPWVVGVNTGTSGDGIDVVVASFSDTSMHVLGGHHVPLPQSIYIVLQKILNHIDFSWQDYAQIEHRLAELSIQAVDELLSKLNISHQACQLIACHGQTVAYCRQQHFTHQIFNPYQMVDHFSCPVVFDFRRWDMAHLGRGAPLIPLFHEYLCNIYQKEKFSFLNIGGIANITVIDSGVIGYDVGPGCCLMDEWYRRHHQRSMDDGGAWAETGNVIDSLLLQWLDDEIFKVPAPRALAREYFTSSWLHEGLSEYRPEDVQATLLALTTQTIRSAIKMHAIKDLCCFGGGSYIKPLMKSLSEQVIMHDVHECFAMSEQWMEPALFAWLGWMRIQQRSHGNIMSVTGGTATKLGLICSP